VQLRQNIEQEWAGRALAGEARHRVRDVQRHIVDNARAGLPLAFSGVGQNLAAAAMLLRAMPEPLKGKCAFGPFLSILVIECQHKCLNVILCPWMNKVQITSKGMFLSLSTLVLCTNILV
jgi:hypothetical protein